MTSTWTESDSEVAGDESAEDFGQETDEGFDAEAFDAEAMSAAEYRRRQRARQLELARRRRMAVPQRYGPRGPVMATPRPAGPATGAAIRGLDLQMKVQNDELRATVSRQAKRMSRAEYAAVAGVVVSQFKDSFDQPKDPFLRAAVSFAPLLLLAPQRRGRGFESVLLDPRMIGGLAVGALVLFGDRRNRASSVSRIAIYGGRKLPAGGNAETFVADVLDSHGRKTQGIVDWSSSDESKATVDKAGNVTPLAAGITFITAEVDGTVERFRLKVT